MIRMCFYIAAFGIAALAAIAPSHAGEGPKPAPAAVEIFGNDEKCGTFSDCHRDSPYDEARKKETTGDTPELENGFSDGQSGRGTLSGTILNLMKPASGR